MYHDNLKGSGRYYSNGSFQTIEKEYRDDIRINDKPTIELDYSAIHPRLLYSMEGVVLEKEWSPYGVGYDKALSKLCLLSMLYAQTREKAIGAVWTTLGKQGITNQQVRECVKAIEEHNQQISKHFYQESMWKSLQYLDSSIASSVLSLCMSRNIAALPYHDSFRVEDGYEEILRGVMFEAWQSVVGDTKNCVVEKK